MATNNPKVTIGMPVYNGEAYIREALDSLLGQSYRDFELIISDNDSSDSTEQICQLYSKRDDRIIYIRQKKNIGAAENFQFVLSKARGEFFMWAASDDRWNSEWLEFVVDRMIRTGAGMCFGLVTHIDSSGLPTHSLANMAHFSHTGGPLGRRLKYFLAHEARGKANIIYSLHRRELLEPSMWSEMIAGTCVYDHTIIYTSLLRQKQEFAPNAILFKRIHDASLGRDTDSSSGYRLYFKKLVRALIPFPPRLIAEYLRHSSFIEKCTLITCFPIKLVGAYLFNIKRIHSKISYRIRQ